MVVVSLANRNPGLIKKTPTELLQIVVIKRKLKWIRLKATIRLGKTVYPVKQLIHHEFHPRVDSTHVLF